ncbi:type VII secretion-associated serine protease mycosin [Spongisporangium articulatum]|uniref:Type VII secretion-associated serine protease mycosin n=1 Tax=Spongisporangium articulatum TaxID=3362603 RepID=A0ABW8ATZ3_9ACTN
MVGGRTATGPVLAGLVLSGVLLVALPATARAESPPDPRACAYENPDNRKYLVDEGVAAQPNWSQTRLQFEQAWTYSRGDGVTVAVVDSGVDDSRPALKSRVVGGYDVTSGKRKSGGDSDCAGHGTMVAGMIAAQRRPGRAFVGVAPAAKILPVRETWGIDSYGNEITGTADNLILALRTAVESGAQIVNVSVTTNYDQLSGRQRAAFEDVIGEARARDVLIVAATGNRDDRQADGNDQAERVTWPAALAADHPNVVAVAGITRDGTPDPNAVTGPYVTLAAPSQDLVCQWAGPEQKSGLVACKGTSFAAPFVSGIAALLRARYPDETAAQIRQRLVLTAEHPSTTLPDAALGYGVPNPLAAVTAVLDDSDPAQVTTPVVGAPTALPASAPDHTVRTVVVAGVALGATLLLLGLRAAVRRGRRRGWRPGVVDLTVAETSPDETPALEATALAASDQTSWTADTAGPGPAGATPAAPVTGRR